MEYRKILLVNTLNQLSKFRTKNWVKINDKPRKTYNTCSKIKFKTSMLKSALYDYSDTYVLLSRTITITGAGDNDAARRADEKDKQVIFKNCAPFTDYKSEINNTQVDHAKDIDFLIPMYNLIECSDNYSKASWSLWRYYGPNATLADSKSFKFKVKIGGKAPDNGNTKHVKITVALHT